jgi:aryl-alcohol dehydrogenase-like predicted oxidoreductase
VTAPIVGAARPHHLTDAVAAVELEFGDKELEELGRPYAPHPVAGH